MKVTGLGWADASATAAAGEGTSAVAHAVSTKMPAKNRTPTVDFIVNGAIILIFLMNPP